WTRDVPGRNLFGQMVVDQPVLVGEGDKVRYIGDAVAAVYADSPELAEEAIKRIKVEYHELEGVFTPQRAMEAGAPLVHEDGNIIGHAIIDKGDVEEAFRQADVIVEEDYYTPFIEQAFLEPEAGLAMAREDGGVNVWVGSQFPWKDRSQVAATLALPEEKVRIIHLPIGGAFGGKQDITVQILTALGAVKTGKPVKMVFSRKESLKVHPKRHAFYMHYKTGANKDGVLVALEAKIIGDTGAHASGGPGVLEHALAHATGPYEIPNVRIESFAVYTNNVPAGAMRGFGPPQVHFAAEQQMDAVARELNMDPCEIRRLNGLRVGSVTAAGQLLESSVGYCATLDRCRAMLEPLPEPKLGKRIGVGVASAYVSSGYPLSYDDEAGAVVELTGKGTILLRVGCVDLGQGSDTIMAQIAADTIGIPYQDIQVLTGDTDETPFGDTTNGSRQAYVSGNAALRASKKFKDVLWDFVTAEFGKECRKIGLEKGQFVDKDTGRPVAGLQELAQRATAQGKNLKADCRFVAPKIGRKADSVQVNLGRLSYTDVFHYTHSYTTQAAIVEVDEASGEVKLIKIIAAEDVGKALNKAGVEGQIVGSVIMGMGYALSEEFKVDRGRNLTDTLAKCRIPGIDDTPNIAYTIIEDTDPGGPFGAKGMGEVALLPTAPAIANAIYDAVGVRITSLPVTKEKVLDGIRRNKTATS
ncbi:MAG: xanthine dehydrogenase family protein molybdopterin-binding subunit, partial [Candidatus Marsarchaeota archaeon]|nr:xanthine dehydrogenase family protein molybdopterin-binding subunit [Candidatus Marsarchaeota archaeon]